MSGITQYDSYTKAIIRHPFELYNGLFRLNMKLGQQQLDLFAKTLDLCSKECNAVLHANDPELLAKESEEIYTDIQSITNAAADILLDAVSETENIVDRLAEEEAKKPHARVRRSSKRVKSEVKQAA